MAATVAVMLLATPGCQGGSVDPEIAGRAVVPVSARETLAAVREPGAEIVLLNVWATFCIPCVEEFPDLLRARREFEDRGLRLVLVSGDFENEDGRVEAFLEEQGVEFTTYIKAEDDMTFIETLEPEWSGALPLTILYDGRGKQREFWEGRVDYETLATRISALLDDTLVTRYQEVDE